MIPNFRRVQHNRNQIRRLGNGNHLPPAPFTLGGTFDDPGQIEELDCGAFVLDFAGDGGQCGEFVGRGFGVGVGDRVEERRFADWEMISRE